MINGGIYCIDKSWLLQTATSLKTPFSFEKDVLQVTQAALYGVAFADYFIDIGVPEDYYRAQDDFRERFDDDLFLFLDRDGVLNEQIKGDYVRTWGQWRWKADALTNLRQAAARYKRIFLVTNQQGVGKGLFTQADLDGIHARMMADIRAAGGRIDKIYTCTDLADSGSVNRKPEIGMALQAKRDFPEVDFTRSVMIGDSESDMLFAYKAGMRGILIQ